MDTSHTSITITIRAIAIAYRDGIATQEADWVDAIRYLRGMQPVRRRGARRVRAVLMLLLLVLLTVAAAIHEFGLIASH